MNTPVPHNRLTYDDAEVRAVCDVVESGWWASGQRGNQLETALAAFVTGADAAIVGSGLAALELSLRAMGIGAGDRVAVPAYSCVAVPNAVLRIGAEPVAVDIDSETFCLSLTGVEAAMNTREGFAAVIAVDTFGNPAPVEQFAELGLPVLEDASHGLAPDRMARSATVIAASFGPTKYLASGGGGGVVSGNGDIVEWVRRNRYYADLPPTAARGNDLMSDIHAAIALSQLERLPSFIEARRRLAVVYLEEFAETAAASDGRCVLPRRDDAGLWYRFPVRLDPDLIAGIRSALTDAGVAAEYPVENWLGDTVAAYPNAAQAYAGVLSLPLYPTLTDDEQHAVIAAFKHAVRQAAQ